MFISSPRYRTHLPNLFLAPLPTITVHEVKKAVDGNVGAIGNKVKLPTTERGDRALIFEGLSQDGGRAE